MVSGWTEKRSLHWPDLRLIFADMADGEECDAFAYSHEHDMHPWLGSPE